MTPFEYVTVLISIILGLGITQIVSGVADLIHYSNRVKVYWPHTLWIIFVFFLHVQEWWQIYDLKTYGAWRLPVFLFTILYPITLFILARILFPTGMSESTIDLKKFYFANYRKFFLFIMTFSLVAILENIFIHGLSFQEQIIQLVIFLVSLIIVVKNFQQEWVHQLFILALVIGMLISFAVNWDSWVLKE